MNTIVNLNAPRRVTSMILGVILSLGNGLLDFHNTIHAEEFNPAEAEATSVNLNGLFFNRHSSKWDKDEWL